MRALVLGGAGAVCNEATRDLAAYSDFDDIVVADYDLPAAEALVVDIGDSRLQAVQFDANDYDAMLNLFPNFDVVVNGLPYKYDYVVNKACVAVGVSGLDLSSEESQFALHEEAAAKDMLFVPGVGATPGTTNVIVRRAWEVLDRMETVDIYFAAFRCLAPAPGLLQTTLWEFNPDEPKRQRVYFENGDWHPAAPMTGERRVRFHDQIGERSVYYIPHNEADTIPRSFPSLKRVVVRGCFPPAVMSLMGSLMRGGLLSTRTVRIGEEVVPAIEAVRALLANSPASKKNDVWAYGLVVQVTGERDGRRVTCTYRNRHPSQDEWDGKSAYYRNVGIPLSIGAQLIAEGEGTGAGVLPPERALPTDRFFRELARRGIEIEEEIVEEGVLA